MNDYFWRSDWHINHLLAHLEVSLPGVEIDSAVIPPRPDGVVYAEEDDHMFAFQLMINYSTQLQYYYLYDLL